jgi:hypothetical protein
LQRLRAVAEEARSRRWPGAERRVRPPDLDRTLNTIDKREITAHALTPHLPRTLSR